MISSNQIIDQVLKSYEQKNFQAKEKAYSINKKLQNDEKYSDILQKIKNCVFDLNKATYDENFDLANNLKQKLQQLKVEKQNVLNKLGFTEQDLLPNYECKNCNDTGFLPNGKRCECFFKMLDYQTEQFLNVQTPPLPDFDNFKKINAQLEKYYDKFTVYAQKFSSESINLVFMGETGTGKTFFAGCIANKIKQNHNGVLYVTAGKMNDIFFKYHTSADGDKQAIYELISNCDLLVIDDLGTEPLLKNVTVDYLNFFISERITYKKPFIITTNLSTTALKDRYSERFYSRISDNKTAIINFLGTDLRKINKNL